MLRKRLLALVLILVMLATNNASFKALLGRLRDKVLLRIRAKRGEEVTSNE